MGSMNHVGGRAEVEGGIAASCERTPVVSSPPPLINRSVRFIRQKKVPILLLHQRVGGGGTAVF